MTPPLPGDRTDGPRSPLTVPLLTAVLAALAVAAAVFAGPEPARGALAVTGTVAGLLLCAAVTVADRAVASARAARTRLDTVTEDLGRLLKEQNRLTEEHTAELARLTEEHTAERARLTEEHTAATDRLTEEHAAHVARLDARLREAESARAAALSATANAAGRMQALATGMLADLRAMEDKHHDEEVLADLLHLDHRTAQAGRLADSVAVLTGARSGRRWARPIAMESILRGAMGRIGGYQRVRAHSASDTAVAGHAAEGVMHALAELLDNAANFSPPTAEVHVYVEEVPSGIIVSVEDSGLVMSDVQLRRAERAVSGESTDLGGLTGTRLGLAVVGRLARRYGLKVSYRPSARGGTSALMLIPQELLVTTGASAPASTGTAPAATSSATTAPAATAPAGEATATTAPAATARAGEATATAVTAATGARTAPATPSEEPAAAPARAADRPAPPAEPTAAGLPRRRSSRTKPAPAAPDHRHDPVPEHESAAPDGEAPPLVLPRRRRGRTLADAERTWSAGRTAEPRPAPTAEETRARTARFSSFRQAVRPTTAPTAPTADDVRAGRDTDTPPAAQNNPTTPEGDTTS
ncbi:signal transduction histidine kinase [Streptomyces calvus]|uniref:sensor histidine kinase n=1 Tax=Streptomyces calvus TaxID=67282 RepID=UPI003511898F